jgi:hypothetical protein
MLHQFPVMDGIFCLSMSGKLGEQHRAGPQQRAPIGRVRWPAATMAAWSRNLRALSRPWVGEPLAWRG